MQQIANLVIPIMVKVLRITKMWGFSESGF